MIKFRKLWQICFLLCGLLLTRLWMPSPTADAFDIDARGYHNLATNWRDGNGFSLQTEQPFCPDSIRTPIFPLFIATSYSLLGEDPAPIFILQSLLDMIVGAIIFRVLYGLSKRQYTVAFAGLLAYTLSLSQWHYTHLLLTESLLTVLLAMFCYFLWIALYHHKFWGIIGAGLFLGLAVLCKPTVQVIILPVLLILLIINWRRTLLLLIVLLLTLSPWLARNYLLFDEVFLSRTYVENLSRVALPATLAEANGDDIYIWSAQWEAYYLGIVDTARQRHEWASFDVSCAEWEHRRIQIASIAGEVIREHPIAFLSAYLKGAINGLQGQEQLYWYSLISDESLSAVGRYNGAPINQIPFPLALMGILWTVTMISFYLTSLIGAIICLRRYPAFTLILLLIIATGLILPGPLAWLRFRVPIMPEMIIFAIMGISQIADVKNHVSTM